MYFPFQKKKPRKKGLGREAHSAGEAIEKMLQERKISSKINYDVLRDLKKTDFKPPAAVKIEAAKPKKENESSEPTPTKPRRDKRPSGQAGLVKNEEVSTQSLSFSCMGE